MRSVFGRGRELAIVGARPFARATGSTEWTIKIADIERIYADAEGS